MRSETILHVFKKLSIYREAPLGLADGQRKVDGGSISGGDQSYIEINNFPTNLNS